MRALQVHEFGPSPLKLEEIQILQVGPKQVNYMIILFLQVFSYSNSMFYYRI